MFFIGILKPILLMCSLSGYTMCLEYMEPKVKFKLLYKITRILVKIPLMFFIILTLWNMEFCCRTDKVILLINRLINAIFVVAIFVSNLFLDNDSKKLWKMLWVFANIINKLQKLRRDCSLNNSIRRRVLNVTIIFVMVYAFHVIVYILVIIDDTERKFCLITDCYFFLISFTSECLLIILLNELRCKFSSLNSHIEDILILHQRSVGRKAKFELIFYSNLAGELIECSELHLELSTLSKLVNRRFQYLILVKTLFCTTNVVFTTFYLLIAEEQLLFAELLFHTVISLYMSITNAVEILVIFAAFIFVTKEANKTKDVLHSHRPQKPSIDHVIALFSDQLYFYDANFTVYGLFPIKSATIFAMLAGAFTNIIILIQFNTIIAG